MGQSTPSEKYPPVNYMMYKPILDLDQKFRRDAPGNEYDEDKANGNFVPAVVAASMVGTATVGAAVAQSMEIIHLPAAVAQSIDFPHTVVAAVSQSIELL